MTEISRLNSTLVPSEKEEELIRRIAMIVDLLRTEFPRIFHRKIQFQRRMNTTMMSRFDVVDLYHRTDERHPERTKRDRQEIAHFPIITINLNSNHFIGDLSSSNLRSRVVSSVGNGDTDGTNPALVKAIRLSLST